MHKLKPGNIVARVVLGESWRERNDTDYLHAEFGRYRLVESYPPAHFRTTSEDDENDDGSSIISTSTTATFDNLPGTGRTLDMYIFQPMGRRIERLAMRFTIASLDPARIAQYIGSDVSDSSSGSMTLHDAIAELCSYRNGSTVVTGMKGLVKQTQSKSVDRSAAALAALIRVSLGYLRRAIYVNVSRIEPIFHLETLVRSHPDEKWLLLLVKLARESLITVKPPKIRHLFDPLLGTKVPQLRPSLETALNLRQRLIQVLEVYRLSGLASLHDTIGEACAICAEAVSTCISIYARGDAYMHILDTVYFTVIFILRSIYELADFARATSNRHIYMVLRTIACWMDAIVFQCINSAKPYHRIYDMELLKVAIAFRSVVLVDVETKYMLLPESLKLILHALLSNNVIPRRNRERNKDIHHIESLIEAAKQRTRRLLRSFDTLEIEVRGCTSHSNYCTTQLKIIADPFWVSLGSFGDEWWKFWKITLERARRVRVETNSLTKEFREARSLGLKNWAWYQLCRASRHKWGQYLRLNMDWDWDLGTCMTHLFMVEEQTPVGLSPAAQSSRISIPVADIDAGHGETWNLKAQENLPKEVRIAYKTETGETQYMSFIPAHLSPGCHLNSETAGDEFPPEESLESMVVQQDSGHGKVSYGGKQEFVDLKTAGASSPDASQPNSCDETAVEESNNAFERMYDAGYDEGRAGEDTISICSLD